MSEKIDLNVLRAKQGQIADAMEGLLVTAANDGRDFDEAESEAFSDFEKDLASVSANIERAEKVLALKAKHSKPITVAGNPTPRSTSTASNGVPAEAKVLYSKLQAFRGSDAGENAYRSGMFLRATLLNDKKASEWCQEHGVVIRAQSEGVNTAGGFLVPTEFEQAIIDLREEYGVFRSECKVVPMGSDSMTIPRRAGGLTAYFVAENTAITESQKTWDQVQLTAKKIATLSRISTELAEDAVINIADDLAQEMAYAFATLEDSCGWNGDGTSAFGGILGVRSKIINGQHTKSAVSATTAHDTFVEVDLNDIATLMSALPKYAERNAKFYCSQPAWALVFQRLIAAAGGNSIETLTGGKPTRSYLGYPVIIDQTLPTSTGSLVNQAMLFFGDLSLGCRMGERRGITIKTSGDRYFELDQVAITATERLDIVAHDLGSTTVAGPIIGLIGA